MNSNFIFRRIASVIFMLSFLCSLGCNQSSFTAIYLGGYANKTKADSESSNKLLTEWVESRGFEEEVDDEKRELWNKISGSESSNIPETFHYYSSLFSEDSNYTRNNCRLEIFWYSSEDVHEHEWVKLYVRDGLHIKPDESKKNHNHIHLTFIMINKGNDEARKINEQIAHHWISEFLESFEEQLTTLNEIKYEFIESKSSKSARIND